MSTMELDVMRAELARTILNEENENLLAKILTLIRKEKKTDQPFPCQMTVEQLKVEVRQSLEDIKNGNCFTEEEMLKKHPEWL